MAYSFRKNGRPVTTIEDEYQPQIIDLPFKEGGTGGTQMRGIRCSKRALFHNIALGNWSQRLAVLGLSRYSEDVVNMYVNDEEGGIDYRVGLALTTGNYSAQNIAFGFTMDIGPEGKYNHKLHIIDLLALDTAAKIESYLLGSEYYDKGDSTVVFDSFTPTVANAGVRVIGYTYGPSAMATVQSYTGRGSDVRRAAGLVTVYYPWLYEAHESSALSECGYFPLIPAWLADDDHEAITYASLKEITSGNSLPGQGIVAGNNNYAGISFKFFMTENSVNYEVPAEIAEDYAQASFVDTINKSLMDYLEVYLPSEYDKKGDADTALVAAKSYTDEKVKHIDVDPAVVEPVVKSFVEGRFVNI